MIDSGGVRGAKGLQGKRAKVDLLWNIYSLKLPSNCCYMVIVHSVAGFAADIEIERNLKSLK